MSHQYYLLLFLTSYFVLIVHSHGQVWKTLVSEFNSTSDSGKDVKNWSFKKQTPFLGSCLDLTPVILGGNPEFNDQIATRTFNMTSERVHYKMKAKFDLFLMGAWNDNIFYGRMNNYMLFSSKYASKNFSKVCSPNQTLYEVISVEKEIETENEKNIELAFADFELPSGGFWGIGNFVISFLFCEKVYTEYNKTLQLCKCASGFYLNEGGECTICPLGCRCEGTTKCSSCIFDFLKLDSTNQACVLDSGSLVIESWTNTPSQTLEWKTSPITIATTNYCGAYSFYGGLSVFKYDTVISRIYRDLIAHYKVLVKFFLFKLDFWDDDMSLSLKVDGIEAAEEKFNSNADDSVGSLCGAASFEAIRRVELALNHESSAISLSFNTNKRISSEGFWAINNFELSILLCHSTCSSCTGPLAVDCKTCITGFKRSADTSTSSSCARDCSKFPNCRECDHSNCLVCEPFYFINKRGLACTSSCSRGFYSKNESSIDGKAVCESCSLEIPLCVDCSYNSIESSLTCINCFDDQGMLIFTRNNTCVHNCLPGDIKIDEYLNKECKLCSSLHPACLTCNSTSCKSCTKPFILDENLTTCVPNCQKGQLQDSSVNTCKICSIIDENCVQCAGDISGSYSCTLCKNSYFLKSGFCVKSCAPNNYIENNNCRPCSQKLEKCLECSTSTFPICFKCESPYFLKNGLCSPTPCLQTQYVEEISRVCKECYNLFNHCNSCTISSCTECKANYYLTNDGLNCVSKCGVEEFIDENKKCEKCKNKFPKCAQCSTTSCISCAEGYFLNLWLCESFNCLPTQYFNTTLQTCSNCQNFIKYCISCFAESNQIKCLECEYGFNVRWEGDSTSCVDDCLVGEVLYNDYCVPCKNMISNCQVCKKSQRGTYECEKCFNSYYLSHFKTECVGACNEGEFLDLNTNKCSLCTYALGFDCKACSYKENDIVCKKCYDSFKILKTTKNPNGEGCFPDCPEKFVSDIDSCYPCSSDNSCQSCISKTSEKGSIEITCRECVDGYSLYGKICVKSCPPYTELRSSIKRECIDCGKDDISNAHYDELTGKCVNSCVLGTAKTIIGSQSICKSCTSNCFICVQINQCYVCHTGFYLDESSRKCVNECPSDTHIIIKTDLVLNYDQYVQIICKVCEDFFSNCKKCTQNQCLECMAGYFLDKLLGFCERDCDIRDQKFYIIKYPSRSDLGDCWPCSIQLPHCKTCQVSEIGNVECLSCFSRRSNTIYDVIKKTCINACPPTIDVRNVVSLERVYQGSNQTICAPCSNIIPFCDECSLNSSQPFQVVCSKCTDDRILDPISNDCQLLAHEIWNPQLFSRYYPQFEETGCAQFGETSKYRCALKNSVNFCEEDDGQVCLKCLEAYFLLPDSKFCVRCPDDCYDCLNDFEKWRESLICRDPEGNFIVSYYLATTGSKSEYKRCSSDCESCEKENLCLSCKEGYILIFDAKISSRVCRPCESILEGCNKCLYILFKSTPPTELPLEDIRLMTNVILFNMLLNLRGAQIVCEGCDKKYYFSGEGKCEKCTNRINKCESCISLKDDTTIYDFRQFIDAVASGKTPHFKVICYACQKKKEVMNVRFTLTPSFDNCKDCPDTLNADEVRGIECQYFGTKNDTSFNQEAAFSLDNYYFYLKEVLSQSVMKVTRCPAQSCSHSDNHVCLTIKTINCIDCTQLSGKSAPVCKACKSGFYLDNNNHCSSCMTLSKYMEGCLECHYDLGKVICTRCSTDGYSLDIFHRVCGKDILYFPNYNESQSTACLIWGYFDEYEGGRLVGNQRKSFCLKCLPGSYPSLRTGGCQKCDCKGCYELIEKSAINITKYIEKALGLSAEDGEVKYYLNAVLKDPLLVSKEHCSDCQYSYQTLNSKGDCIDCEEDCLKCESISDTAVCTQCRRVLFSPYNLNEKDLVRNYYNSPAMFYPFSLSFYSSIDYFKDNDIPNTAFERMLTYMNETKYFNPGANRMCKPCPYGCSNCEHVTNVSKSNYLDQYTFNCTGCRPGFYMDKFDGIYICRFCVDLDSCTSALRLKYLFTCAGHSIPDRDSYRGYIQVLDFDDFSKEISSLKILALKNMHHEAYLKELEITLLFPTNPSSSCEFSSYFEIPLILDDLSHVLKVENTNLRLGSYNIKLENSEHKIEVNGDHRSTIKFKLNSYHWHFFQFGSILIENLFFEIEGLEETGGTFEMEFDFRYCLSLKLKNVTFTNNNTEENSNYFIFKLEQLQTLVLENTIFEKLIKKGITPEVILFSLPNVRSILINSFEMISSYFERSVVFSAGNYASNITINSLTLSKNELRNFILLKSNLINESEQPVVLKKINIESTLCSGCSVLVLPKFSNVYITDFKLVTSILKVLTDSVSMNSLLVFNIIPNITNVEIKGNSFYRYHLFMKSSEYVVIGETKSILSDWVISKNKIDSQGFFSGAFLIDHSVVIKGKIDLLVENMFMESNTIADNPSQDEIQIPFISIKELRSLIVKGLKINLTHDNYYMGLWNVQAVNMIRFSDCTIEHLETPSLDHPSRHHLKQGLFYFENADSVTLAQIKVMRICFYESAIKIIRTSEFLSVINEILISNSDFMFNGLIVEEFTDSGLIKIESKSQISVIFIYVIFQDNFINKNSSFFSKSASCILFNSLKSSLNIESSIFVLNTASNIYVDSFDTSISNTQFKNMSRKNGHEQGFNPSKLIHGGYIKITTSELSVKDSLFTSGWAYNGGAIHLVTLKNPKVSISNSIFEKLYAINNGGALLMNIESSDYIFNFTNLNVRGTFANQKGGFVHFETNQIQEDLKKQESFVYFSKFNVEGTVALLKGSFLSSIMLSLSFEECVWMNSEASNDISELKLRIETEFLLNVDSDSRFTMGIIEIASLFDLDQTHFLMKNSTVDNYYYNTFFIDAIFLRVVDCNVSLDLVKISNSQFSHYGVILGFESEFTIFSSKFRNLSFKVNNENDEAEDELIFFNTASPFWCQACSNIVLNETTVDSIKCSECSGGFLFISSCESEFSIIKSLFTNIDLSKYGGAMQVEGCKIRLEDSSFKELHADNSGGVIFSKANSVITIINCNIEKSSAVLGGAFFVEGGRLYVYNSEFYRTNSIENGGAFFVEGGLLYVYNSVFYRTNSTENGGAIFGLKCDISIIESSFKDTQSSKGGMIMVQGGKHRIDSCEIINGSARLGGGAIYIVKPDQDTKTEILNSRFKGFSSQIGGIIYGEGSEVGLTENYQLIIEKCVFESANAFQGGAMMIKYLFTIIHSSVFLILRAEGKIKSEGLSSSYKNRFLQEETTQIGGGGIFAFHSTLKITNTTFAYCMSNTGGAIYSINGKDTTIIDCIFYFNEVHNNGGALNFQEVLSINISKSLFIGNQAGQKGGAVYSYSESSSAVFTMESVNFENNSARIGGAMKYFHPSTDYKAKEVVFNNNKALDFGADITSRPKAMRLVVRNNNLGGNLTMNNKTNSTIFYSEEYIIEEFRSSADMNSSLIFSLLDEKGEVISEHEKPEVYSATISIHGPDVPINFSRGNISYLIINSFPTSEQTVSLKNNTFVFENLKFQGAPESTAVIVIKSPQIKADDVSRKAQTFEFKIKINFRKCLGGEFNNPLGTCDICQEGYYSLSIDEGCLKCPENVASCQGNILNVTKNFWRKNPYSKLIIPCNSEENCDGGIGTGDETCKEGKIGALCGSCDIYAKRWPDPHTSNGQSCVKCDNKILNIIVLVFFSLMQLAFTYFSIQGVLEMSNNETAFRLLRKFYSGGGENLFISQYNYPSVYVKIFMNYVTIVGFISNFNLQIDTSIFEIPEAIGSPLEKFTYAVDCHIIVLAELFRNFHIIYLKMIFYSLMPLALLIVFVGFYLLLYLIKLVKVHLKRIVFTAVVFIVLYQQPSIIFYIFSVISCIKIGDELYVQADLSLECYSWEHKIYGIALGVPFSVLWGILIPFLFIRKLWSIRKCLDLPKFVMKYGFLYSEYKTDKFFWEFIKIYQKFLMIGFLTFFKSDPVIKGLLVLLVLTIYFYLLVKINPYKFRKLYIIDIISCGICFLSILFALLCHENPYKPFVYLNIAIIVTLNIIFSAFCLLEILNIYLFDIKQKLEALQIFIASRIPFLAKCCTFRMKKFKTLQNWRRLKLAIHNYRRALGKVKADKPESNELNFEALEIIKATTIRKDSNPEKYVQMVEEYQVNEFPGGHPGNEFQEENKENDSKILIIPASKNIIEDQI